MVATSIPRHTGGKPGSRPRLCFLAYRHLAQLAAPVVADYAGRADIEVVEGAFDRALNYARERVASGAVDVFVSAGANGAILRTHLQTPPVAIIQVGGYDLMQALLKARRLSTRVGIVTYGHTIPELDEVKDLLKLDIAQYAYQTPDDARVCFERLRSDGFNVIVGSSLVVEMAEMEGLTGLLAYSTNGVRRAFDDALELARVTRLESGRFQQLNAVLGNLQDGVLAVDRQHRIIAINPRMQQLLDRGDALLGEPLDRIEPELSLVDTMEQGTEERALVQRFRQRDWIVNRTPIREHGDITGAAITLYDAQVIEEADTSLRRQQRKRQTTAKYQFGDLVGRDAAFVHAIRTAKRFAATDLTVLISGESGSGKELFAQAIHSASPRASQPFVALNCAAFPEPLLESELFGHEEGAFTGARRGGKRGLFETAHKGTLFLDEIGDMPLSLQTRLLRVLQEHELMRVGGVAPIPVDVRVIAATHQPLLELIGQRLFRQDLYYRINTLRLALPPLRERPGDIVLLAVALVTRSLKRLGSRLDAARALQPLMPRLTAYAWPGNVRELENIADRLAVFFIQFGRCEDIRYDELYSDCPELFDAATPSVERNAASDEAKSRLTEELARCKGNRTVAARRLGISRSTLWRWIKEEGRVDD